jgi:prepilin-type N-terminal cleavage/methylation domain-containing protein
MKAQGRRIAVNGFTLVELLVVISIIALLLAVLMPALAKVREQAKLAVCKSNLRQTGMAVYLYANDNKGEIPPFRRLTGFPPKYITETSIGNYVCDTGLGLLFGQPYGYASPPYMPDAEFLYCPGDMTRKVGVAGRKRGHIAANMTVSYLYIYFKADSKAPNDIYNFIPRTNLTRIPSKRVLCLDSGYWGTVASIKTVLPSYHKPGMNYLRADTSVQYIDGRNLENRMDQQRTINGSSDFWLRRIFILDNL